MLKAMKLTKLARMGMVLSALSAAIPAMADTQFRIRRMTRDDVPVGKGQCDIRLQVDGEVEVSVRRDSVLIRTISGRDAFDDGSECNAPLPDRDVGAIRFDVLDSRNDIRLLSEPSRRNDFAAIVRIRDRSGGQGRYHFRLSWQMTGSDYRGDRPGYDDRRPGVDDRRPGFDRPGYGGPGFAWNNVINFRGRGRGVATLNNFEDRLSDVDVNIDRGGKIVVVFRAERGRTHGFNGQVTGRDGGRLRADVVSDDRRLRGPMFISVDDRQNVISISLEATDGRDRLHLAWDRR
jgi:hypothetical protein